MIGQKSPPRGEGTKQDRETTLHDQEEPKEDQPASELGPLAGKTSEDDKL